MDTAAREAFKTHETSVRYLEAALSECNRLRTENKRLRAALKRAEVLVGLVTVRQAIHAGNDAIEAAGLNPWAMNEGLATGDERVSTWWLSDALNQQSRVEK